MARTLATRLSGFFVVTLFAVLVGFSVLIHALTSHQLNGRLDDRLTSAMAVLVAAAEVHDDAVEWEGKERDIAVGLEGGPERLLWVVEDAKRHVLGASKSLMGHPDTVAWLADAGLADGARTVVDHQGVSWRRGMRVMSAQNPDRESLGVSSLAIIVATPLQPVQRTLVSLDLGLVAVSSVVMAFAAILGRWWARRALMPLISMAESARGLDAADPGWTVHTSGNGDEVDGLGTALNDLLGRLHLAYERQRRFAGDASHQLRTPLTAIMGQLEVALRRDRDKDELLRVLSAVRAQAGHLAKIVEALLFLGRAEADAGLPEMTRLDLSTWLEAHLATSRHQVVVTSHITESAFVRAHPVLLGALIDNLLDNAAEHGGSNEAIDVVIHVDPSEHFVVLEVRDHGRGISGADLPRVFEPFFRSSEARKQGRPGVGLGLAVVERIARAFGGSIAANSPNGGGASFIVCLPQIAAFDAIPDHEATPFSEAIS